MWPNGPDAPETNLTATQRRGHPANRMRRVKEESPEKRPAVNSDPVRRRILGTARCGTCPGRCTGRSGAARIQSTSCQGIRISADLWMVGGTHRGVGQGTRLQPTKTAAIARRHRDTMGPVPPGRRPQPFLVIMSKSSIRSTSTPDNIANAKNTVKTEPHIHVNRASWVFFISGRNQGMEDGDT